MTRRLDIAGEVLGGAPPRRQFPVPVEAEVVRVDGGLLYVAVAGQPDLAYGPVSWSGAGTTAPLVGTACLVVFAGVGADRPWVVAFAGWHPT